MKVRSLTKQEIQLLFEKINSKWPTPAVPKKPKTLREAEVDEQTSLIMNGEIFAVVRREDIIPYLGGQKRLELFPRVVVDAGAVKFICNGADVMRPGIRSFEGAFQIGDYVAVKEEVHGKFLVVGRVLATDTDAAKRMEKGAVIENLHYIGDNAWNFAKSLRTPS